MAFFISGRLSFFKKQMEAVFINKDFSSGLPLQEAMIAFFEGYTPESVKGLLWRMFQCWVTRDCKVRAEISDEELALFFDQLMDLVAAAYVVHQANGVSQGGGDE